MSSSSSTMRISDAISDPFLLIFTSFYVGGTFCPFGSLLTEGEGKRNDRSASAFFSGFGIGKDDVPAMVFHDLAYDGQAQSRALGARGHVRFGQAMAMFRRQAHAIVGDADAESGISGFEHDGDAAGLILAAGDARGDAL